MATKKTTTKRATAQEVKAKKTPARKTKAEDVSNEDAPGRKSFFTKKVTLSLVLVLGVVALLFAAGKYMVVAWVDNKPISKLELYGELDKRYGEDLRQELIVEKLIVSEASRNRINVSNDEINSEISKIETQQGGADKLNQILEIQKISRDDFLKLVKLQLLKQKLFGKDINITDEEVNSYLETNKDALAAGNQTVDDKFKEGVKEQLKQQKVNENFNKWLTENLAGSRVVKT
jgi:foldase protein PrsA